MDQTLDIIPIHIIADSANKSEILNSTLRARGLTAKPLWLKATENWQGPTAEIVFYFADTDKPTLEQAVAHADRENAALIVVARESNPRASAQAIAAGADDWVRLEDGELLVEVALRERRKRRRIERSLVFENERLKSELAGLRQTEAGTRLLLPSVFAPIAARQIGLSKPDCVQALAFIRPADPQTLPVTFGALGTAEAGTHIATIVSSLLDERDFATRIDDSNILALVVRADESEVENWMNSLLRSLAKGILEGGGHSARLDFVGGYTPVDRIRPLDVLIRQAQKAADDASPGEFSRGGDDTTAAAIDDNNWESRIREALEAHRYKLGLLPIEDLASGARSWVALPRLLDHGGREIATELFQPPAKQLGLLPVLERRLVGHALRALLTKQSDRATARVIVPLHATTLADAEFFNYLQNLLSHAGASLPRKSLVLEFDIGQISSRIRETEQFVKRALAQDCGLGLRGYEPEAINKSVELLPIESVRMASAVTERIANDDKAAAAAVKAAAARLTARGIRLIAGGVADTNTMARLYNLGVGMMEGPAIGEFELFRAE